MKKTLWMNINQIITLVLVIYKTFINLSDFKFFFQIPFKSNPCIQYILTKLYGYGDSNTSK